MRQFLTSSTIFLVLAFAGSCWSQSLPLTHNGQEGIWFPAPMAKLILSDVKELEVTRDLVTDLRAKLDFKEERIVALKEALAASESSEKRMTATVAQAIADRDAATKKLNKWYRHPALWASVGVVLTVVLEVVIIQIVGAVD